MRLLRGLHNPGMTESGCVATIGNFDGVHRGHQRIVAQLKLQAERLGLPAVVVVFEPQPLEFFKPEQAPARLMTFREKFEALRDCEVDAVFCLKFDQALSRQSGPEFIEKVLRSHLCIKHLVVGDDFRFGDDRQGNYELLETVGRRNGYTVENTPTLTDGDEAEGVRVSSTGIRQALASNDFASAERMLGRPYVISGKVQHGRKLGKTLGFPTANLNLKRLNAAVSGVYAVRVVRKDGRVLGGVANIGNKPTIGQFEPNLEVHVLDHNERFYGERIRVEFVAGIRSEKRFDGLEQLKQQIRQDIDVARQVLGL